MGEIKKKKFEDLKGETLTKITGTVGDDLIVFELEDGTEYKLYHEQDCCEDVSIEDICGDLYDLIGSPLLIAEEIEYDGINPKGVKVPEYPGESFKWTFYKLGTIKGNLTIRWYGSSNGYYSESVYFCRVGESFWD